MAIKDFKQVGVIRSAAILTGSYVAGTVISGAGDYDQLLLDIDFTLGSLTNCDIKIEEGFADATASYYQHQTEAVSAGVATESDKVIRLGADKKGLVKVNIDKPFIKISAIGNGTATSSSLAISATLIRRPN